MTFKWSISRVNAYLACTCDCSCKPERRKKKNNIDACKLLKPLVKFDLKGQNFLNDWNQTPESVPYQLVSPLVQHWSISQPLSLFLIVIFQFLTHANSSPLLYDPRTKRPLQHKVPGRVTVNYIHLIPTYVCSDIFLLGSRRLRPALYPIISQNIGLDISKDQCH